MVKRGGNVDDARKKLDKILKSAIKNGYSLVEVIQLPGSKKMLNTSQKCVNSNLFNGYRAKLSIPIMLVVLTLAPQVRLLQAIYTSIFGWQFGNVKNDFCILSMPDDLTKIFRPPVTCTMCHDVREIEKVANLSAETFEARYAYTGRPIVVVDGMTNWTAQKVFGFEFFKKVYTKRMDRWRLHNCQFFPYNTEFKNLADVFNMSKDRADLSVGTSPWYIGWSNCDDEINQILRRHYQKPYFLPETAESKKLDWIFMGSSGFGAPMHVDNVEHPSWQAQLRGKKKWLIQPPPECYYECQSVQIVVEPGEIIVLDTNRWYHSTLIISDEISITIGAEFD